MRTATMAALALTLALGLAAESSTAVAHKRELGAHEHGRGTLNMALEGNRLTMELEVPGFDIVGFEHMPTSRKDKAAARASVERVLAWPIQRVAFCHGESVVMDAAALATVMRI